MGGKKPMNVQHNRGTWGNFSSHHHASAAPMSHESYANANGGLNSHSTGLYDVGLLDLGPQAPMGGALHGAIGSTRASSFYAEHAPLEASTHDIDAKVMELVDVIGSRMRRQLKPMMMQPSMPGACTCSDDVAKLQDTIAEMQEQMQALMAQVNDKNAAAVAAGAVGKEGTLTDRVSTLEGRQSAFQSQMAQLCKSLGTVPTGKNAAGKPGGIALPKPLLQELRDEFDAKLNAATVKLETAMNKQMSAAMASMEQHILNDIGGRFKSMTSMQYDDILSLVASETDICLQNTKQWFDDRCSQEAKHRMALEARMNSQFDAHAEWLQQLEGLCDDWHTGRTTGTDEMDALVKQVQQLQKKSAVNAGGNVQQLQAQVKQAMADTKTVMEAVALLESNMAQQQGEKSSSDMTTKKVAGLQKLVEKMMRDQGSVESMLQQYVSTITHQVASVTRQYVSVRIRDNNRLLDATLRARIPAYVENEHENFMLVRPTNGSGTATAKTPGGDEEEGLVLRDTGSVNEKLLESVLKMEIEQA
ncbi:Aste57867_22692 [Aphanomyces stellatus]|uniref:Aste57867_22692 protein n=1 Tax=Aphanomyces stellatus TaxID=120398 RepID=A0A485LKX3_9STRA|nr:hypothetical protein As57867_022622 [Aphanomyces stellatus]VFT99346.1 Aste57867_22692 [Aphanomyces stellatus]